MLRVTTKGLQEGGENVSSTLHVILLTAKSVICE